LSKYTNVSYIGLFYEASEALRAMRSRVVCDKQILEGYKKDKIRS
jgi:hypothetical protein